MHIFSRSALLACRFLETLLSGLEKGIPKVTCNRKLAASTCSTISLRFLGEQRTAGELTRWDCCASLPKFRGGNHASAVSASTLWCRVAALHGLVLVLDQLRSNGAGPTAPCGNHRTRHFSCCRLHENLQRPHRPRAHPGNSCGRRLQGRKCGC